MFSSVLDEVSPEYSDKVNMYKVDIEKEDAHWHCTQHDKKINTDRQTKGCNRHNYIPELIPATLI